MVKEFSDFRNDVVMGVAGSTPTAHHIFFSNGMHFQVTSLLLCMQGRSVPYARTQVLPHRFDNFFFFFRFHS